MKRTSQWEVVRRCLRIIVRLERGPTSRDELLATNYPGIPTSAAIKRFENDLARLRDGLDVDIGYDHDEQVYFLRQSGLVPLLDLPDEALKGLVFLDDTFEVGVPQYQNIQSLLDLIAALLSESRRSELARARSSLDIDLRQRDQDVIDSVTWNKLERAYSQRRMVVFDYLSPQQSDQQPRRHLVESRKLYFDTVRRHYYLWGYCHQVTGPQGAWIPKRYFRYRLGRIIPASLEVLPDRFPAIPPAVPLYKVVYRLNALIARFGISYHFENTRVEAEEDGTTTVYAETDDIFYAARTLLYYGPNCKVLGGPELLQEIRQIVQEMVELYNSDTSIP